MSFRSCTPEFRTWSVNCLVTAIPTHDKDGFTLMQIFHGSQLWYVCYVVKPGHPRDYWKFCNAFNWGINPPFSSWHSWILFLAYSSSYLTTPSAEGHRLRFVLRKSWGQTVRRKKEASRGLRNKRRGNQKWHLKAGDWWGMSTPYTHSVAETNGRSYLSNEGSKVCVSRGCIYFFIVWKCT